MSHIDPENTLLVSAVLLIVVAMGFLAERTRIGKRISGAIIVLIGSLALTNAGVLPEAAPFYDVVWAYFIPMGVSLYLFRADIVGIFLESRRVLLAFTLGALGVVVGAIIGGIVLDMGPMHAELAGIFTASYTGGSLNFAAVADAVDVSDTSTLAAAVAVDNMMGIIFFLSASFAGGWTYFRNSFGWRASELYQLSDDQHSDESSLSGETIAVSLALAAVISALGIEIAAHLSLDSYSILFVSAITVLAATIAQRWMRHLYSSDQLAAVMMYIFFAVLGAGVNLAAAFGAAATQIIFVGFIIFFHLVFVLIGARLFGLNYGEVIVASVSCLGGPAISAAYAVLFGWRSLLGAAVATGVLGYAIGNFLGVSIFELVAWLGS